MVRRERRARPTEVQGLSPGLVLVGSSRVAQLRDLTEPGRGPEVEYLSVSRCEELPRVSTSITVPWVSSYQDAGLTSRIVRLVDWIFVTESIVPCRDCSGCLG